jgi:hypothetical protein
VGGKGMRLPECCLLRNKYCEKMMRIFALVILVFSAFAGAYHVAAESCAGNPNALGTSRVLYVDPVAYKRVGTIRYRQGLPLEGHEGAPEVL